MSRLNEGTPFPDRPLLRLGMPWAPPGLCQGDPLGSAASWRADNGHSFVVELYFTEQGSHRARVPLSRNNQYLGATGFCSVLLFTRAPLCIKCPWNEVCCSPDGLLLAELSPLEFRPALEFTLATKGRPFALG